jgi:hypothetical protein
MHAKMAKTTKNRRIRRPFLEQQAAREEGAFSVFDMEEPSIQGKRKNNFFILGAENQQSDPNLKIKKEQTNSLNF